QLKQGAYVTDAELMSFLATHIGERAALPKAVHIIPAMPLTAVGKIFKPALKQREIEDALSNALQNAGVLTHWVKAHSAPAKGITLEVVLADSAHAEFARDVLGYFPSRYRLATSTPQADIG